MSTNAGSSKVNISQINHSQNKMFLGSFVGGAISNQHLKTVKNIDGKILNTPESQSLDWAAPEAFSSKDQDFKGKQTYLGDIGGVKKQMTQMRHDGSLVEQKGKTVRTLASTPEIRSDLYIQKSKVADIGDISLFDKVQKKNQVNNRIGQEMQHGVHAAKSKGPSTVHQVKTATHQD